MNGYFSHMIPYPLLLYVDFICVVVCGGFIFVLIWWAARGERVCLHIVDKLLLFTKCRVFLFNNFTRLDCSRWVLSAMTSLATRTTTGGEGRYIFGNWEKRMGNTYGTRHACVVIARVPSTHGRPSSVFPGISRIRIVLIEAIFSEFAWLNKCKNK